MTYLKILIGICFFQLHLCWYRSSIPRISTRSLHSLFNRKYGWHSSLQNSQFGVDSTNAVQNGVNLAGLTNYLSDGKHLRTSITEWLDREYIEQIVHNKIGCEVETLYLHNRQKDINDLGDILIAIGSGLERFDLEDAFVNAWDVANKAAELLMLRLQEVEFRETKEVDTELFAQVAGRLSPEFNRYKLLRDFIEGYYQLFLHHVATEILCLQATSGGTRYAQ